MRTLRASGNQTDTLNLDAQSPGAFRVDMYTDPDEDGLPDVLMATDMNGNGVYTDAGDFLDPAHDVDFDNRPDTGVVAPAGRFGLVLQVTIPGGVPNGTEDVLRLTAISADDPGLFAENFDITVIGAITASPDRAKRAVEGTEVYYAHQLCNLSGTDDSIDVSVSSSLGWPVAIFSDPNGDGDPADGAFTTNTGVITDGDCVSVVVVLCANIARVPLVVT